MTTSLDSKYTRYVSGGVTEVGTYGIEYWEKNVWKDDSTDLVYTLTKADEKQPWILAQAFYGNPNLMWVILQYNNILDVQEEFVEGIQLLIPTRDRVFKEFLKNPNGGVTSKRTQKQLISPVKV
ncbi:hypothetical protein RsoM2USA_366 [Ralstonia phage RsoM2USA]|nr:hypothetical protein RsoM2USA_366 [Ralstonia phage RsoM2USA]